MPSKAMPLKLYFYSNRNIVGLGLGIVAALAAAIGVIQDYSWLIIAGSYGVGALVTPSSPTMDVTLAREMSDRDIIAGLARIAADAPKLLPKDIAPDVVSICASLSQAIPSVAEMTNAGSLGYEVRTTATEYLPQTLDRYLRMPPTFRMTVKVDGKTADEMLREQIGYLRHGLDDMMVNIASADTSRMAANGLFLKEKFSDPAFSNVVS